MFILKLIIISLIVLLAYMIGEYDVYRKYHLNKDKFDEDANLLKEILKKNNKL